jgi:peptide/nickel transport system substrate-binding protein
MAAAVVLATGCSEGEERGAEFVESGAEGPALAAGAEPGTPGGALVMGALSAPKSFNPVVSSETSSSDVWHLMFDRLVAFDPVAGEFVPRLAESWSTSPDGLTWRFKLREGLKWSDGEELTSADVLFAFELTYDDAIPAVAREVLSLRGEPFEVTAPDPLTVVITTKKPYGPMLYALSSALWPLPGHGLRGAYAGGGFSESMGVGTAPDELIVSGPFRLELAEPGRTILSRNPHYWRVDENGTRLPYLDRVVFVETGDWNSWRLKFEAGEVDYYRCRPEEVSGFKRRKARGDYSLHDLGLEAGTTHFWYNLNGGSDSGGAPYVDPHKLEWFSDVRFRRATSHAIDRASIVRAVYHGWGDEIYGPTSPVDALWYNPKIPKYEYDPESAEALLAEMGLLDRDGDGIREDSEGRDVAFTFISNVETPARTAMGNMISGDLKEVGVDATFSSLNFNTLITLIGNSYKYDACLLSLTQGPDPVGGLDVWMSSGWMHAFAPNQPRPATGWEAEVDRLVFENLTGRSFAERKESWDKVQALFAENLGFIYVANQRAFVAVRNKFGNLKPQPYQEWHRAAWNAEELYVKVEA